MDQTNNQGNHQAPNALHQLEEFLYLYLHKKSPFHIPPHVREWIVKFSPWIDVVLLILTLPVVIAALGLSLFVLPFGAVINPFGSLLGIIHWVIILGVFALQIAALPGLFKRSLKSWYLVYYSVLLGAVGSLLSRDIFGLIIGTAIGLFILFEIKDYYR